MLRRNRFLTKGKDPIATDADGNTSLHKTIREDTYPAVVEELLAASASVDTVTELGYTLLHVAVRDNANLAVVEVLLDAGASVNAANDEGFTPLHEASRENASVGR